MQTLGFCAAGLAEIAKRVNQPTIRHLPQFWEALVRLEIRIDDLPDDSVGAVETRAEDSTRILLISA